MASRGTKRLASVALHPALLPPVQVIPVRRHTHTHTHTYTNVWSVTTKDLLNFACFVVRMHARRQPTVLLVVAVHTRTRTVDTLQND